MTTDGIYSLATISPPVTVHRFLGLERFDIAPAESRHHLSVRLAGGWLSQPDFVWSPYQGFSTALDDRTAGVSADLRTAASPNVTNELRVSWTYDNLAFPRPHPEIPNLLTDDDVALPQAGVYYGYQNRQRDVGQRPAHFQIRR
jgi:hypothetical protein